MLNKIIRKIIPRNVKGYSIGIHLSVIFLSLFGFLMVISANGGTGVTPESLLPVVFKEGIFVIVSYLIMIHVASRFNYKFVKRNIIGIMVITVIMNIVPLFFSDVGGAKAWIRLPGLTIQPSEFTKVIMILVFTSFLADRRYNPKLKSYELAGIPVLFLLTNFIIIALLQSDLGSAVVLLFMIFFVAIIPQNRNLSKIQFWVTVLVIGGFIGIVLLSTPAGVKILGKVGIKPYMLGRFLTVSDPFFDRTGDGYHIFNGFISFVSGGWFGKGLGASVGKHGFIPEARTDFILAIIVEELGMFGLVFILLFYGIILYSLLKNANRMKYEKDKMILIGVAAYLMVHFLFNVGGITALIPLTGVPLLLISSGASSKISFLIAIGIAQSTIAKGAKVKRVKHENYSR